MKTIRARLSSWAVAVFLVTTFMAEAGWAQPLEVTGTLLSDQRFRTGNGYPWSWSENRISLSMNKSFQEKARFNSEIWVRSFGFPFITKTEQLFNTDQTSPYDLNIRQAYIDLYGFIFKNMDVRLGRQVIPWGRGDKLNPTRNLNPLDLEDIWDFGRYDGVEALKVTYYLGTFNIEGVYVPFYRPATLPKGDFSDMFTGGMSLPAGLSLASLSDTVIMPELKIGESASTGIRLNGFAGGFDFSLSYVYGRESLPIPYYNTITPADMNGNVKVKTELAFPRSHIIGADLAGAVGSVGIWSEMALFIPKEEIVMTTDLSAMGWPLIDSVVLEKKPYIKYLVGTDYTFRNGLYINFQFLHGFFHERGSGNLNDYLVMNLEKKFLHDKLKVTPLAGAFIIGSWKDLKNDHALIYTPMVTYMPNENTELTAGIRVLAGKGDSPFASIRKRDECFLKLVYSF